MMDAQHSQGIALCCLNAYFAMIRIVYLHP